MNSRSQLRRVCLTASALIVGLSGSNAWADYPIMSHRYLADPGAMVYNGRVYLYNSNDDDNNGTTSYLMKSIVCVSSSDMKNWTDHGIVFQVPADASWASYSWAPVPLVRDNKFYLYFGNNASGVGVATSDSPTGEFKDPIKKYLVNSSTPGASGASGGWLFDPGALIDDDGKAYLSFGGNGQTNGRVIQLGSDLISTTGSAIGLTTTSTNPWFEASYLFKRSGIYYLAYSTTGSTGQRMDYFMSTTSPMAGWTYAGVLADQPPDNGNNNHTAEFEFKGRWYHAYHNRTVAKAAGIDPTCSRNLGLEVLDFQADGKIVRITSAKYTKDGVPQVGNLNPYVRVEAETMNAQSGIETEKCTAGGMDVTQISSGDWVGVRGVDFGAGATSFTARVASTGAGGNIELRLGSATGTLIGTCSVPSTGGAQTWKDATCNVTGASGVKDLYLKFTGGSFNFDYWQFSGSGPAAGGAGGAASTGGAPSTGGSSSTGGRTSIAGSPTTGGTRPTGGAPNLGGASATGGNSSVGGTRPTGGASTVSNTGGSTSAATGGSSSVGGAVSANGGAVLASGGAVAAGGSGVGSTTNSSTGGATGVPSSGGSLGLSGATGTVTSGDMSSDEGSCGCRVAGKRADSTSLAMMTLLAGLMLRRSGRRSIRRSKRT